jgi:hypothetical protein
VAGPPVRHRVQTEMIGLTASHPNIRIRAAISVPAADGFLDNDR